jgi:DNA-binding GntR family transcriptional regulator
MMVRVLSRAEVIYMFELRGALEVLSAQLAAERADLTALQLLEQSLTSGQHAIEKGNPDAVRESNREFHQLIRTASQNPFIPERMGPLVGRLEWAFRLSPEPKVVLEHHRSLFQAITQKQSARIGQLMEADNLYNRGMALWILDGGDAATYRGAGHLGG